MHLLVDSTGLKFCGPGEWLVEKHGTKRRRAWRVLHLATDADTGRIVASVLTDKDADDGSQVASLLERIDGAVRPSGTAPVTATMSTPRSRPAIPPRPWSCHRARMRCRARPGECADAARPASAMHRRARAHGLAEGVGVQLARPGGVLISRAGSA